MPRRRKEEGARVSDVGGDPSDAAGLSAHMRRFLEMLRVKGYSEATIKQRTFHLRRFRLWCEERSILRSADVTKQVIERHERWLFDYRTRAGRPLSLFARRAHLITLRIFFRWLSKQNLILYNPVADLEMPRKEKSLPRNVLTRDEVEKVLALADVTTAIGLRDRAMMEVFYSTGIRRSELMRLTLRDLDASGGTVFVHFGKGKKDRVVPIGERALAWVDRYLANARPALVKESDGGALFLSCEGNALSTYSLSEIVSAYVQRAELGKRGACHMFRHTMATVMLEGGADLRFVQAMLGHSAVTTTQIYTHVAIGALKEVHAATHPGAKMPERAVDDEDGATSARS